MLEWLAQILVCPRDLTKLSREGRWLICQNGHRHPIVADIPVMLIDDIDQTAWWAEKSSKRAREAAESGELEVDSDCVNGVDPFVQQMVAGTCGILYRPSVGKLTEYPIPDLRMPFGDGKLILDVGCNWGRWSVAAARKGYRPIGIDPSLEGVLAAKRVLRSFGIQAGLVVGDARHLPFNNGAFDRVFSYSVIQHFSKANAREAFNEIRRVLRPSGQSMIQMPNRWGLRSLYNLSRRGFEEGKDFDVRYWTVGELSRTFEEIIGPSTIAIDGFFGLGIQPSDRKILPPQYRIIISASEALRSVGRHLPILRYLADSLYVISSPGSEQMSIPTTDPATF